MDTESHTGLEIKTNCTDVVLRDNINCDDEVESAGGEVCMCRLGTLAERHRVLGEY